MLYANHVHQELFNDYCLRGCLVEAKQLWMNLVGLKLDTAFKMVSLTASITTSINTFEPMIVWLLSLNQLSLETVERTFSRAAAKGNTTYIDMMHNLNQNLDRHTAPYYLDEYVYIHSLLQATKNNQTNMVQHLLDIYPLLNQYK